MGYTLDLVQREISRLNQKSLESIGLGLTLDDVKKLEILIKTSALIRESQYTESPGTEEESQSSRVTDEDILKTLR